MERSGSSVFKAQGFRHVMTRLMPIFLGIAGVVLFLLFVSAIADVMDDPISALPGLGFVALLLGALAYWRRVWTSSVRCVEITDTTAVLEDVLGREHILEKGDVIEVRDDRVMQSLDSLGLFEPPWIVRTGSRTFHFDGFSAKEELMRRLGALRQEESGGESTTTG